MQGRGKINTQAPSSYLPLSPAFRRAQAALNDGETGNAPRARHASDGSTRMRALTIHMELGWQEGAQHSAPPPRSSISSVPYLLRLFRARGLEACCPLCAHRPHRPTSPPAAQHPKVPAWPAQYPGTEVCAKHALHSTCASVFAWQISAHSPRVSLCSSDTYCLKAGVSSAFDHGSDPPATLAAADSQTRSLCLAKKRTRHHGAWKVLAGPLLKLLWRWCPAGEDRRR